MDASLAPPFGKSQKKPKSYVPPFSKSSPLDDEGNTNPSMILTDFDDGLVGHSGGSLALVVPQPLHWLNGRPAAVASL